MTFGRSVATAPSISANTISGSQASARARQRPAWPPATDLAEANVNALVMSASGKGGFDDTRCRQVMCRQDRHGRAFAEHIDPVAMSQFLELRGVPDEGPTLVGLVADQAVDLLLGGDVDAPHRIVEDNDVGSAGQRP